MMAGARRLRLRVRKTNSVRAVARRFQARPALAAAIAPRTPRMEFRTPRKVNQNALDYFCSTARFVGSRTGHVLHHGRIHTHLAGPGDHHVLDPSDAGPKDDFLTEENNQMKSITLVGILLAVLGSFCPGLPGLQLHAPGKGPRRGPDSRHAGRNDTHSSSANLRRTGFIGRRCIAHHGCKAKGVIQPATVCLDKGFECLLPSRKAE